LKKTIARENETNLKNFYASDQLDLAIGKDEGVVKEEISGEDQSDVDDEYVKRNQQIISENETGRVSAGYNKVTHQAVIIKESQKNPNKKIDPEKYLVDKKFNTFLISWKNPDASSRNISFKEYIEDGVLEALRIVCEKTGSNSANIASYCVGGTLASLALAYLKVVPNKYKITSATFFASLIDFEDPGELGIFITEEQIASIENQMKKTGYFDGKDMAAAFNFLRPVDLYWNYVVNNYLLGNEPTAFDMLHWNSDSTRLSEKMHSEYLRCMYLNNLVVKNKYKIGDVEIDLSKIDTPIFSVATTEDHIAPWRSVYQGLNAYNSHINFVLANSGHIAGIIQGTENKPGKLHFYTKKFEKGKTQDEWFNSANKVDGSWWPVWISWLAVNSGQLKKPSELNAKNFEVLYEAPGQYVKQS